MLSDIVDVLRNDPDLAAELAEAPWGGAAVYTEWAPEHPRPYITLGYSENLTTIQIASGSFTFDVWGDGTSHIALEPIRDVLRDALDHRIIDTDRGPLRMFYDNDGPEREDDPSLVRWRIVYAFRRTMTEIVTT